MHINMDITIETKKLHLVIVRAQTYGHAHSRTDCVFKCINCIIIVFFGKLFELSVGCLAWSVDSVLGASVVQ